MDSIKTMKKLGVSIKRLRKKAGLSQTELSSMTGLRQATISKIESTGCGQIESLMKIIQALNSSISLDSESVELGRSSKESFLDGFNNIAQLTGSNFKVKKDE